MVGDSFQEGATVTFECDITGYEPLDTLGAVSEGITCQYIDSTGTMEWIGDMPTCNGILAITLFETIAQPSLVSPVLNCQATS